MKIVRLEAQNVKRLSAVEITPDGHVVVVGGQNGAGKTSVLDAIMYALAGGKSIPAEPIRRGAKSGSVRVELDGERALVVTRRITPKGGSLEVRTADGTKASSPQRILDELCGRVAFDPLSFTRKRPRDQADALRELVGVDFAALDAERERVYDQRSEVNREVKRLCTAADAFAPIPPDTPDAEVSVADLLETLSAEQEQNAAIDDQVAEIERAKQAGRDLDEKIDATSQRMAELQQRIDDLRGELTAAKRRRDAIQDEWESAEEDVAIATRADTEATERRIADAERINADVRRKGEIQAIAKEHAAAARKAEALTERIAAIDAEKVAALESAEWPVDGLGFSDDGITLNGLPFDQASAAEQLRVSVAVGFAANPALRVLLIRDGSLLDDASLRIVAEMAAAHDGQVWLERVGEGAECSVVIEDGHVKTEPAAASA